MLLNSYWNSALNVCKPQSLQITLDWTRKEFEVTQIEAKFFDVVDAENPHKFARFVCDTHCSNVLQVIRTTWYEFKQIEFSEKLSLPFPASN